MTFEAFNKHMLNDFKTISYAINDGMHVNKECFLLTRQHNKICNMPLVHESVGN